LVDNCSGSILVSLAALGPTINTTANAITPAFSRDGHWMFFTSTKPGGYGAIDVYASWRNHVHDDFDWETPVNLGPNINTSSNDQMPDYFANDHGGAPELLISSDRPGGVGGADLYQSELQARRNLGAADRYHGAEQHRQRQSAQHQHGRTGDLLLLEPAGRTRRQRHLVRYATERRRALVDPCQPRLDRRHKRERAGDRPLPGWPDPVLRLGSPRWFRRHRPVHDDPYQATRKQRQVRNQTDWAGSGERTLSTPPSRSMVSDRPSQLRR
jgi:hypothetical protein